MCLSSFSSYPRHPCLLLSAIPTVRNFYRFSRNSRSAARDAIFPAIRGKLCKHAGQVSRVRATWKLFNVCRLNDEDSFILRRRSAKLYFFRYFPRLHTRARAPKIYPWFPRSTFCHERCVGVRAVSCPILRKYRADRSSSAFYRTGASFRAFRWRTPAHL